MLGINNLNLLLEELDNYTDTNTEATIELNPEHLEDKDNRHKFISLLKKHKVNRVSVGVQTINEKIKKLIARNYCLEKLATLYKELRVEGFNISFDFMFALPDQTISSLQKDLNFIEKCSPHHVSIYLFTPPENYPLISLLPDEGMVERMFDIVHKKMTKLGYDHYEISNYAIPGKESIHNLAYWDRTSYIGLGAAAHSFLKQEHLRYWHSRDVQGYLSDPLTVTSEKLTKDMEYTETIMLGLRTFTSGVTEQTFKGDKYRSLLNDGLLERRNGRILVPFKHIPILDSIIKELTC